MKVIEHKNGWTKMEIIEQYTKVTLKNMPIFVQMLKPTKGRW